MKLEKLGLQGKSCALLLKPTLLKGSAFTLKANGILSLFVLHFWLFHYHSMSSCWMFAAKSAICNSRRHVLLNAFYSPCTKKNTCFMLWGSLNSLLTYSILMWLILMWKYFKNINKLIIAGSASFSCFTSKAVVDSDGNPVGFNLTIRLLSVLNPGM